MQIQHNQSLKTYNTFGLDAIAKGFIHIISVNDLYEVLAENIKPIKILGGGSNILLKADVDAYVLHNEIQGIEIISENQNQVLVEVGSGELWHNLVLWSLSQNLGGFENLSLIPGSVGAAPMQNIGAYGIEQDATFFSLKAIHMTSGISKVFFKHECNFGYRESIFKNDLKDQYFITHVSYLLQKQNHVLHLEYGAIKDVLHHKNIINPTIHDVSAAVIEIRKSKLPDPKEIGNSGSFFKNPVVSRAGYDHLKLSYTDLPCYPQEDGNVKIPAGWLIEKIGYKGKTMGNIGVHKNQALVLVNYGGGKGSDIYNLALEIKNNVAKTFGIDIQTEVNIW
ncbi:MAG: UDP-N-acetylmuramate dehydrogenase [Saprospiraceae bacterium]|nr:UDP-N-acetylmuramate dehydrogenase [Saprospiraceae bacterium]